jgi:hypothetical protein
VCSTVFSYFETCQTGLDGQRLLLNCGFGIANVPFAIPEYATHNDDKRRRATRNVVLNGPSTVHAGKSFVS